MPETTADGMCLFAVNLAYEVISKDCKNIVTREATPHKYLAARLWWAGYDVWVLETLTEVCVMGDQKFSSDKRIFDLMFGYRQNKESMK